MLTRTKVFLVEDHPVVCQHLAGLINQRAGLTVCGEAATPRAAIAGIARTQAHVAVIDLRLQNGCGLGVIKDLRAQHSAVAALVFTGYDEPDMAVRAAHAGARGFVSKQQQPEDFLFALGRVARGHRYFPPATLTALGEQVLAGRAPGKPLLTDRQFEVAELLALGRANEQIAVILGRGIDTVKSHVAHLKVRLGVHGERELISAVTRLMQCRNCPYRR